MSYFGGFPLNMLIIDLTGSHPLHSVEINLVRLWFWLRGAQMGGRNPCPHGLWHFFTEYINHSLRHLFFIIFHQYLPWFPSQYHPRIMSDQSHCQNIHSQCQHRCLQNFCKKRVPQSAQISAKWGIQLLFGQCPNKHL